MGWLMWENKMDYINAGGNRCPNCGSNSYDCEGIEVDGSSCSQKITCGECHKSWFDIYKLTDIEEA